MTFLKKTEILRSKTTVVNDSNVNNINKNKPNNNKNYNNSNKIRNEYYCHIYAKLKVTLLIIVNIIF